MRGFSFCALTYASCCLCAYLSGLPGVPPQDDGSTAVFNNKGTGKNKMVRNEKGLWVKAKDAPEAELKGAGRGRGGGIPVEPGQGPRKHHREEEELSAK